MPLAAQEDDEGDGAENDEDDDSSDVAATVPTTDSPDSSSASASRTTKRKNKGKKKKKAAKGTRRDEDDDEELQELQRALNEVNAGSSIGDPQEPSEARAATLQTIYQRFFAVETRMLDADTEMRKLFGARIVNADLASERRRQPHGAGASSARRSLRKFILAPPRDTWPPPSQSGLLMEMIDVRGGTSYFQLVHSPRYQEIQFLFLDSVDTLDPANVMRVLNMHPYHIDSLLTLSEVCKHQGDVAMAAELVERALFAIERAFHSLFTVNTGLCRLIFTRTENRSFFLAVFRHIQYLGRKGCWRTALEFAKMLISFDPGSDPLSGMLLIDFLALRARVPELVVNIYNALKDHKKLYLLPNWAYSFALSLFHQENINKKAHGPSTNALLDAMARFPSAVLPLAELCGVTLPSRISKHAYFAKPTPVAGNVPNILLTLFVERNASLWKEAEVLDWWRAQLDVLVQKIETDDQLINTQTELRKQMPPIDPLNVYRHVFIADINKATGELPGNVSRGTILMHDPLPPPNSTIGYTRPVRQRPSTGSNNAPSTLSSIIGENTSTIEAFFRSLLPWAAVDPALQRPNDPTVREAHTPEEMNRMLAAAGLQEQDQPLVLDWIRRATQNFVNHGVFNGFLGDHNDEDAAAAADTAAAMDDDLAVADEDDNEGDDGDGDAARN